MQNESQLYEESELNFLKTPVALPVCSTILITAAPFYIYLNIISFSALLKLLFFGSLNIKGQDSEILGINHVQWPLDMINSLATFTLSYIQKK